MAARLVVFVILTACRSIKAREAVWSEFDLTKGIWTIAKERMKAGREHTVPLSSRAVEMITKLSETRFGEFVFCHARNGKPYSVNAPRALLKRMGRDETLHGFRAEYINIF